jgi:hypothetical protein
MTTFVLLTTDRGRIVAEPLEVRRDAQPPITAVNGDYERVERDLAVLLESRRKTLQPETIATVERNLAIIDSAIAEIRQALAADPTVATLAHHRIRSSRCASERQNGECEH